MKLKKVAIRNFRGIQNIEFDVENLTTIIGRNNCGKSSILRAIELVCTSSKPDLEEFYKRDYQNAVEIEVVFDNLHDWERRNPAISGIVYNNQVHLKYIATAIDEDGKIKCELEYKAYSRIEEIRGWQDSWAQLSGEIKEIAIELGIDTGAKFKPVSTKEQLKQRIRDIRQDLVIVGEPQWSNDSIPFNNALQQVLPKIVLIPAVKNAEDESKFSKTGKSSFSELIRRLVLPQIQAEQQYQNILQAIQSLSERVHGEEGIEGIKNINNRLSERLSRLINAKANIRLLNPEIDTLISSNVGLRIHDGEHDTPIGLQGHGLQRTLIFSLLEMVAENDAIINNENTRSTIVLYEEPELYLHPQMLRKLKNILLTIGEAENWQVVCSTHSPVFINVADNPRSLIILSKAGNLLSLKQLIEDPFEDSEVGRIEREALRAALTFHPTVCEVFFTDSVVLVEGDTEMVLLKHCEVLLLNCNIDADKRHDVTVVSCGGKWTIPAIATLLNRFGINYKIVHDEDRHGKTEEQLLELPAIHPYRANARIQAVCNPEKIHVNRDTIEDLWGGSRSNKPYSALVDITNLCNNNALPESVRSFVRFVYSDALLNNY